MDILDIIMAGANTDAAIKKAMEGEGVMQGKDGVGIQRTEKVSSSGLVDTYRIYYTDGSTWDYTVTNGGFQKSNAAPAAAGNVGDIVFNSAPEPGGWIGWVYTPTGWYGFGEISLVSVDVPETAFLTADGTPFILNDGSLFIYADS